MQKSKQALWSLLMSTRNKKITESFSAVKAGPVKQSIWLSRQVLTKWTYGGGLLLA